MKVPSRLAAVFVFLALVGCSQVATGQGTAPTDPYPPENSGHMDKGVDM
jgi:hypothetical protein